MVKKVAASEEVDINATATQAGKPKKKYERTDLNTKRVYKVLKKIEICLETNSGQDKF